MIAPALPAFDVTAGSRSSGRSHLHLSAQGAHQGVKFFVMFGAHSGEVEVTAIVPITADMKTHHTELVYVLNA